MRRALLCLGLLWLGACSPAPVPETPTVRPTASPTRAISSPTPEPAGDCLEWDRVEPGMEGEELCVFGDVLAGFGVEDDDGTLPWWIIRFSEDPGAFHLVQDSFSFTFQPGDCLQMTGRIQLNDGAPYIENGEVARCP